MHFINDQYMIEFTSLERLKMYDMVSKKKGRICLYTCLDERAEPFLGFSDDTSKSKAYLRKFKLFQKSLFPVVALKRLPKRYVRGGRFRIADAVEPLPVSPGDKIDTHPIEAVGCQFLIFDEPQRGKESNTLQSDLVPKVTQRGYVEKEDSIQAQQSTEDKSELEENVENRRLQRPSMCCRRTRAEVKSQLISVNDSTILEVSDKDREEDARVRAEGYTESLAGKHESAYCQHSSEFPIQTGEIKFPASSMDVGTAFQNVANVMTVENPTKFTNRRDSAKSPGKCREEDESQPFNVDILKKSENGFLSGVSDSVHKGPDEGSSIQTWLSSKSKFSPKANAGKANSPQRHNQATTVDIESLFIDVDSSLNSKCSSKICSGDDQLGCSGFFMDVATSVQKVPTNVIVGGVENDQVHPENKVEPQLPPRPSASSDGSGVNVESHFLNPDCPKKYDEALSGNSSVRTVIDEVDLDKEERIKTQLFINHKKIPVESNVVEEKSAQPQYSEKSEMHHNTEQSTAIVLSEDAPIRSTWNSMDHEEDIRTDKPGSKPGSSKEALELASPKGIWALLIPCVVRLERVHHIEKMVRRADLDDTINYPVIVKGGQGIARLRTHRRSFSVQRRSRPPRKQLSKTSLAGDCLTKIDLSDGMALKKFCQLNSISLVDSDSDGENFVPPHVLEDHASSPILPTEHEVYVSSQTQSNKSTQKLPKPIRSCEGLDPSADSVVSENPVPSGVQALNELGFLEHGSFQFGKEHPSESIWSDVLDFGEVDGSGVGGTAVPRGKYCDLLLPFEDNISIMNSEKEIEVDYISNEVNADKELDDACLEAVDMSTGMEEDLAERVEQLCHDVLNSDLLGKECLENDPLSNEPVHKLNFESSESILAGNVGAKSMASVSLVNVSHKRRNKGKRGKERRSHRKNILDSTPSDKEYKEPLTSNEGVNRSKVTPVGESEFLTSLINPGKVMRVPHLLRGREKIVTKRKYKSHFYLDRGDNGTDQNEPHDDFNKEGKRRSCNDSNEKGRKRRFHEDSWDLETNEVIEKQRIYRFFRNGLCEIGDQQAAKGRSVPIPRTRVVNALTKKRRDLERENAFLSSLEAERAEKELEYKLKKIWMNNNFKVGQETKDIPTSEALYHDLSTIPYILKCNLQNRCRKCKNLNPCANANKKFKLFFTLTVGVGRRLSKPLMETLQGEGDGSQITQTAAYVAASAAVPRPTTILVPALPEVVRKILPTYHANLLMQLVAETEELEKAEKKTLNDMAVAETLQLKRAVIAMKAKYLESGTRPHSPQSNQTFPDSESIILESVQPGPFMYKSNQIIALKSKVDNRFRFVRKCLVSLLPNKGAESSEDTDKKSNDVDRNQSTDSQGDKICEAKVESNTKNDVDVDPPSLNQIHRSSPKNTTKRSVVSMSYDCESMEPLLKKLLLDPSCNGRNMSHSKVPGESPSSSGISSMESEEVVEVSTKNKNDPNGAETRNVIIAMAEAPKCVEKLPETNECSPSIILKDVNPTLPVQDIELSESRLARLLSSNSTPGSTKLSTFLYSTQTSGSARGQNNPNVVSQESPEIILIPDKIESVDLTTCDEEAFEPTSESAPKWAVICTSLPELGFIKVEKTSDKLIIYDKAVVSEPLEINTISELNKFLNTRLAKLKYSYQSKIALEWILVTSGYLDVKTIPPTNPLFWLPSVTAKRTLTNIRNFAKRYGTPQTKTGTPIRASASLSRSTSLSIVQTMKDAQDKVDQRPRKNLMPSSKGLTKLNSAGKIVRINGQRVVMGTPLGYRITEKDNQNPSSAAGQTVVSQVRSAQVASGKLPVSSTPCYTPVNRFLVVRGPNSVPISRGPRTFSPGLICANSSSGYVGMANNTASSVVQTNSLSSTKSSSAVPDQQISSSPLYLILPNTTLSQSTSFQLTPCQPVMANTMVSSAAKGFIPQRHTTPVHLIPPALNISSLPSRKTTAVHIPLNPYATRTQTHSSLSPQTVDTTTTIRRPFRQIVVTPGSVRCTNLTRIAPHTAAQAPMTVEPSQKTHDVAYTASKQVLAAPAPKEVLAAPVPILESAALAPKQVSAAPEPKQVFSAPIPKRVSAAAAPTHESAAVVPRQMSTAPAANQVSPAAAPKQISAAPEPKQVSAAAATSQGSIAVIDPAPIQVSAGREQKQATAAPAPKQVSAAPVPKQVLVRCSNVNGIAPRSIAPVPLTVQPCQKTYGLAYTASKQLSAALAPDRVSAAAPTNKVSIAVIDPAPITGPAATAPEQLPAALKLGLGSAAAAPNQGSPAPAPEQESAAPSPKQVSAAPAPKQETTAPSPKQALVPVTLATATSKAQTALKSTICASTALSMKLAEALSQKLGQKVIFGSNPPNNRQILIIRKGAADQVQTSNPNKLVSQKPGISNPLSPP